MPSCITAVALSPGLAWSADTRHPGYHTVDRPHVIPGSVESRPAQLLPDAPGVPDLVVVVAGGRRSRGRLAPPGDRRSSPISSSRRMSYRAMGLGKAARVAGQVQCGQSIQLLWLQHHLRRCRVGGDLLHRLRADDRRRDGRPRQQPGKGNLIRPQSPVPAQSLDGPANLHLGIGKPGPGESLVAMDLPLQNVRACQQSA
jgi:hypothetical protein